MNKAVWNERVKMLAALFQSVATTVIGLGMLAPCAAVMYNPSSISPSIGLGLAVMICAIGAALCHGIAQLILGRLRE